MDFNKDNLGQQIIIDKLNSLPSKDDLKVFATKEDIQFILQDIQSIKTDMKSFVTKEDLRAIRGDMQVFATKDDLNNFATKEDLRIFATKDDLSQFATKNEIQAIREDMKAQTKELKEFAMDQTEALARVIEEAIVQPLEDVRIRVVALEQKVHRAC